MTARFIALLFVSVALAITAAAGPITEPPWRIFKSFCLTNSDNELCRFYQPSYAQYGPITLPPHRALYKSSYAPDTTHNNLDFLSYYYQAYPYQYYSYPQHYALY